MLLELARKYGTDKLGHGYMPHYERHFNQFRNETFNLLEIGVHLGASLRMWKEYFPNAIIHGIDRVKDTISLEEDRIKIHIGDQNDRAFMENLGRENNFRVVIDDGSHLWPHQINSLSYLFPLLQAEGHYVIEDLHTSYHGEFSGGGRVPTLDILFCAVHDMNTHGRCYGKISRDASPNYYELHVAGIHFYKSICFVEKNNKEG